MSGPKLFRDPVHGFIEVDEDTELQVIDHPVLQRLRRIHQLALTMYVYPGADHKRFSHVIGTMEVAGRIFDQLVRDKALAGSQDELQRKRRLVRLAALVHDVGHAPFSHAGEEHLFPQEPEKEDHESFGMRILQGELGALIDTLYKSRFGISKESVIDLLSNAVPPEDRYLWQIISSPIDADKMDYLLRDKHYCGVRYGEFDLPRIVSKMTVHEIDPSTKQKDRVLGLRYGAVQAYEEFFLARHWMSAQVYFHPVRRQLDIVLRNVMAELLPGGRYSLNMNEYLTWDDGVVFAKVFDLSNTSKWATRLREPRPYFEKVFDESDSSPRSTTSGETTLQRFDELRKELQGELGTKVFAEHDARVKNKLASSSGDGVGEDLPLCVETTKGGDFVPVTAESAILTNFPRAVTYFRIFVERDNDIDGGDSVKVAKRIRATFDARRGKPS